MRCLGIARAERGRLTMPDSFQPHGSEQFDVVEVGGALLLTRMASSQAEREEIDALVRV